MPHRGSVAGKQHLDLRTRRRLQAQQEIHSAAVALATEQGMEKVTVEDIAERAGVSVRTFFRYFPTKDRALVYDQLGVHAAIAELLTRADPDELHLRDIEAIMVRLIAQIDNDQADDLARSYRVIVASPQIMAASQVERAELLACVPPSARTRVRLLLDILGTVWLSALCEWVETDAAPDGQALLTIYRQRRNQLFTLVCGAGNTDEREDCECFGSVKS
ncbi:TetR family transcriptional regulator [Longimycelium tulufanense]|uniref:TetR family transcriptional regulator n=1 Tax=Longimycelium tulufanense TaxID=907463 RepID=A0A8J3CD88_9PSEU|nr:TetR family transcriptional regulator [Longimycelium tulufanense]GGM57104.1 TetR family transcriptional regulator [Longimycelium tulufanense]